MPDQRIERLVQRYAGRAHASDQWDTPPSLRFILEVDGKLQLGNFDLIPPSQFSAKSVALISDALLFARERTDILDDVRGVLSYSEAWMLEMGLDSEEDEKKKRLAVEAYLLNHRLAEHPDRIEVKTIVAMDLEQTAYLGSVKRGRDFDPAVLITENAVTDKFGEMTAALAKLTTGIRKAQNHG